jgi:hypothetical protein
MEQRDISWNIYRIWKVCKTILSADDHVVLATSENELQILVYKLNKIAQNM